ncbi:MAG: phage exclusion protein Lit family protein [Bacteroidales bacterium]
MKASVKKETHSGNQPIRVLKHNLTARLVERNEEYIISLQSDFRLNKNIQYHAAESPIIDGQTPYINEEGIINLHETYLSYVWIVCYHFFVLHEEDLAIPDLIKQGLTTKAQNLQLVKDAEELFSYGKSLIVSYYAWDKDNLPNPEFLDEQTDEGYYILRTNDLYVEVLNFILYHETAHAEFEHIKQKNTKGLKSQEQKDFEIEADSRAIELILSNGRNRNVSELAIIIGLGSMLFFRKSLDRGSKHPNIDIRLENAIRLFSPKEESPIWTMLSLFLKIWDKQFALGLTEQPAYDTYKDLYCDLLSQIKQQ